MEAQQCYHRWPATLPSMVGGAANMYRHATCGATDDGRRDPVGPSHDGDVSVVRCLAACCRNPEIIIGDCLREAKGGRCGESSGAGGGANMKKLRRKRMRWGSCTSCLSLTPGKRTCAALWTRGIFALNPPGDTHHCLFFLQGVNMIMHTAEQAVVGNEVERATFVVVDERIVCSTAPTH